MLQGAGPGPRKQDGALVPQQAAKNLQALFCPRIRFGILVLVLSYGFDNQMIMRIFCSSLLSVQKIAQISLSNFQKMVSSVCLTIPGGGKEILPPSISYFVRRHGQFEILRVGTRGVNSKNILFDHLFSISDMDLDIFYYFFGFRYM